MDVAPIVEHLAGHAIRDTRREDILKVLEVRLHPSVALAFKPALDSIENTQQLEALFDAAIRIDSLEEFRRLLAASSDSAGNGAAGQS